MNVSTDMFEYQVPRAVHLCIKSIIPVQGNKKYEILHYIINEVSMIFKSYSVFTKV